MTPEARRWDRPWTAPAGSAPERAPGEPGFALLAAVHLAVLFGLGCVGSLLGGLARAYGTGAALVGCLAVGWLALTAGGLRARARRAPLADWVADLLLTAAGAFLGAAVGVAAQLLGASDRQAELCGCLAALPFLLGCYVVHRRLWLQVGTVAAAAGALVSALLLGDDVPDPVYGGYLLVLAGFVACGALSGVARPVRSAAVLAAVLATGGCQVLLSADALDGTVVTGVVLAGVVTAVVRTRNRSLLPVVLLSGVVLLPQLLDPAIGTGRAVGLSLSATAAAVAWLAVDLARRAARPVQIGGVMAVCLALLLVAQLLPVTSGDGAAGLLDLVAVGAFFAAAAAGRRRAATVLSGVVLVASLPGTVTFDGPAGAQALVGALALAGAVAVAVWLDRRAPRPAASPFAQEQALTGPGADWTLPVPYAQGFDAVVGELASAGLVLQLVDRATGRVVAGDAVQPWLTVALWATDPVQCHLRAVGPPANVARLRQQLDNRLVGSH
jgi:hypothetical protein